MREFLICESCNASVEVHENVCAYCGTDFRAGKINVNILRLKEQIDNMFYRAEFGEILELINESSYKEHAVFVFRKAKVQLLVYMINDGFLDSQEFCEALRMVQCVSEISPDYWTEFVLFTAGVFPTEVTKLFIEDFQNIIAFLKQHDLDREKVLESKLLSQLIVSEAGETFMKEYNYFTNASNFVNSKDFIHKRDFLMNKYDHINKKITNQLEIN